MTISRRLCLLLAASLVSPGLTNRVAAKEVHPGKYLVYVGTYTTGASKGLYAYRFDAFSGQLTPMGLAAETMNPSFVAVQPNRRFILYAVNEITNYKGQSSGALSAFAIDHQSGKLSLVNQVPSGGADPCYVSLDKTGRYVLVANYTGGSVSVFPVRKDGGLGEASASIQHVGSGVNTERQEGPHAHWIEVTRDNRFAIAADLGLDQLKIYRFNVKNGSLAPNNPEYAKVGPGAGPRHFAFHPSGRFGYVVNEMKSTIDAFSYDAANGRLRHLQTVSTLPKNYAGKNDTAELKVHPSGKFLYASNRGQDSIAIFAIDDRSGTLKPIENVPAGGKTPRSFEIDPSGSRMFVANQDSDNIVIFRINSQTGRLTPTGQIITVPSPVCVKFVALQ